MCGGASNTAILVIDGTYIFIQVRTNLSIQNVTFSNLNFRSHEITNFNEKPLIYIRKDLY